MYTHTHILTHKTVISVKITTSNWRRLSSICLTILLFLCLRRSTAAIKTATKAIGKMIASIKINSEPGEIIGTMTLIFRYIILSVLYCSAVLCVLKKIFFAVLQCIVFVSLLDHIALCYVVICSVFQSTAARCRLVQRSDMIIISVV